jgi:lysophospholipase L1-like esterase
VVLYEGDNDIAAGKSPEDVFEQFERFTTALHRDVPDAQLIVLAIKPSGKRWDKFPLMLETNEKFRSFATQNDWVRIVDLGPLLLDANGKPRDDLFRKDRLHMNDEGYKLWSEKLRPMLEEMSRR